MKKIGIYGSYSAQSIGDHYILDGIINQLKLEFEEEVSITVFTNSPDSTRDLLNNTDVSFKKATPLIENSPTSKNKPNNTSIKKNIKGKVKELCDSHPNLWFCLDPLLVSDYQFWKRKWKQISDLDIFIFGGGNILMDLFPYSVPYHYIYSKLADISDTPSMYYSVGAGPFRSARGRFYYNHTLKNVECVSTRDKESLQLIEETLNTKGITRELSADPALCLNIGETQSQSNKVIQSTDPDTTQIAVSLVPYYKKGYWSVPDQKTYQAYIETMAEALTQITTTRDANLVFFATNHPTDIEPAEQTLNLMDNEVSAEILRDRLTGKDLVSWLANCDLVLCTRLHSLIPTFVAGTPFIAYAYQPKVQYFCTRIGHPEQSIDLSIENDEIIDQTQQAVATAEEWSGRIPNHDQKLGELRSSANKSVQLAKAIAESDDHEVK